MSLLSKVKEAKALGLEGWQLVCYIALDVAQTLIRWGLSTVFGSTIVDLVNKVIMGV
jgi:F0F1-type ATP synthase assembly protein I